MAMSRTATRVVALCAAGFAASSAFSVAPSVWSPAPGHSGAVLPAANAGSSFGASATAAQSQSGVSARALVALAAAAGATALIVQNKGGGHGEIGYHLALQLAKEKGLKVTMITDTACKKETPPFNAYADLEAAGVVLKEADLKSGGLSAAVAGMAPCDYVFHNDNVCADEVQDVVAPWNPKAYAYVSSGGMYKPVPEGPLLETGEVKGDNKQLGIEQKAAAKGLKWSAFRPQYIYGPKTNKPEYLDWFLDRIVRDLPFPLPADGSRFTTLSNAIDVAGMLACVVDKEDAAAGQVFNCANDVLLSHKDLVTKIAKELGKDPDAVLSKVVFYDPAALKGVDLPKKGKFPFRETNFGVSVDKAKSVLGFSPKCSLEQDLKWYIEDYLLADKHTKELNREWDEAVIAAVSAKA